MVTNNLDWVGISAICLAAVLAVILIVLLKKGLITKETVTATGNLLESLPVVAAPDSFVGQLYAYAQMAVSAVEQLVKTGVLPKGNDERKSEAKAMVETYAKIDGIELGETDRAAIDTLIEAAVAELPRNDG